MTKKVGNREALEGLKLFLRFVLDDLLKEDEIVGRMDIGPVVNKPVKKLKEIIGRMDIGPTRTKAGATARFTGRMDIGPVMWQKK